MIESNKPFCLSKLFGFSERFIFLLWVATNLVEIIRARQRCRRQKGWVLMLVERWVVRQNLGHSNSQIARIRLVQELWAVLGLLQCLMWVDLTHQICLDPAKIELCLRQVYNLIGVQTPYVSTDCVLKNKRRTVESLSIGHYEW